MPTFITTTATVTGLGLPQWAPAGYVTGVEMDFTLEVEVIATQDDPYGTNLRTLLGQWWGPTTKNLGRASCQEIALDLLNAVRDVGFTVVRVSVSCALGVGSTIWAAPDAARPATDGAE